MNVNVQLSPADEEYIQREHIILSSFISKKIDEERMGFKPKYDQIFQQLKQIDEKLSLYVQILQKIKKSLPNDRIDNVLCINSEMDKKLFELNEKINLICFKLNIDI